MNVRFKEGGVVEWFRHRVRNSCLRAGTNKTMYDLSSFLGCGVSVWYCRLGEKPRFSVLQAYAG